MPCDEQQKKRIEEDRVILNEQNKEYAESLAKDLAKKEEKAKALQAAERSAQRLQKIHSYRENLQNTPSTTGPLRLLIRYPNGARAVFAYSSSTQLGALFDAILANPACPDYFSVRTILPSAEVYCWPPWYQDLVNEEEELDEPVPKNTDPTVMPVCERLANHSILFINMIH